MGCQALLLCPHTAQQPHRSPGAPPSLVHAGPPLGCWGRVRACSSVLWSTLWTSPSSRDLPASLSALFAHGPHRKPHLIPCPVPQVACCGLMPWVWAPGWPLLVPGVFFCEHECRVWGFLPGLQLEEQGHLCLFTFPWSTEQQLSPGPCTVGVGASWVGLSLCLQYPSVRGLHFPELYHSLMVTSTFYLKGP